MKKVKFTKETLVLSLILILSATLNFANISIEGYANGYYAAGVKSMLMSLKNFFFVSFDPAGFVTIDKPPVGFWIQTISAKIFGFSGWSILLPQALAGVISVWLVYYLVKRSFGIAAGLISALCLAVTPVFVAASRSNTIDNLLVVTLLFACWALSIAAEKGKVKYLLISLALVGVGFNIKMLQAYMVVPALYITYLISSVLPVKKRIKHLVLATVVLLGISFSWAVIVDLVPASNRPFVGSSTNNTVKELILGHNGLKRIIGGNGTAGGRGQMDGQKDKQNIERQVQNQSKEGVDTTSSATQQNQDQGMPPGPQNGNQGQGMPRDFSNRDGQGNGNMQPPGGGGPGGSQGRLAGSFGAETPAGITRLFSKNILSDQIVWFLPLAFLGLIAGAIKEKLKFPFDNKRKLSLALWSVWLIPEFIYFSFTTGLFHPYYLTMMAPPIAALTGIGITSMYEMHKEGGWRAWILPAAFVLEGLTQLLMFSYFYSSISTSIKAIIITSLILCFAASAILAAWNIKNIVKAKKQLVEDKNINLNRNKNINLRKVLVSIALIGTLVTPFIGASAPISHKLSAVTPSAGLELLSNGQRDNFGGGNGSGSVNTKLVEFLKSHKTNEKYLLVVSSAGSAQDIIVNTGESVMALGGFSGSDKILTLDQFKELVKKGEVRYVMTGGMGGRDSGDDIMSWVQKNGTLVPESEWKDSNTLNSQTKISNEGTSKNSSSVRQNFGGPGGGNSGQLYDLKNSVKN